MRILKLIFTSAFLGTVGGHAALAKEGGLPQLDVTTYPTQVIWLVISFTVLFFLMSKVALPRISEVLEERQNKIDDNLAKAEELKIQAESAKDAFEKSLADARAKAQEAIRDVKDAAYAEASERQKAQSEQLQAKIAESEQAIAKARDEAMSGIKDVATDVAASAVEKLIGEAPKDVAGAIDAALKDRA